MGGRHFTTELTRSYRYHILLRTVISNLFTSITEAKGTKAFLSRLIPRFLSSMLFLSWQSLFFFPFRPPQESVCTTQPHTPTSLPLFFMMFLYRKLCLEVIHMFTQVIMCWCSEKVAAKKHTFWNGLARLL